MSRCKEGKAVLNLCRVADDGKWYLEKDFKEQYGANYRERWNAAPHFRDSRKSAASNGRYRLAPFWFEKFGENWYKTEKPGWQDAEPLRCLAKDGEWYTLSEFQDYYPDSWLSQWEDGPRIFERRYAQDRTVHDAKYFYDTYGKAKWKSHWNTAVPAPSAGQDQELKCADTLKFLNAERRMADDGLWYTQQEFRANYPTDHAGRWATAPPEKQMRTDSSNLPQNAKYFFELDTVKNIWWNKDSKGSWDKAPLYVAALADDGVWYKKSEFAEYYPHDFEQRWENVPKFGEERYGEDGLLHDARYFFIMNELKGGKRWNKWERPGWDEAPPQKA